jgi:hypothetical protein
MLVVQQLERAAIDGELPTVVVEDLCGLSLEFVGHLIATYPKCAFSKRAAKRLLQSQASSILSRRAAGGSQFVLLPACSIVICLVITAISSGAARWP